MNFSLTMDSMLNLASLKEKISSKMQSSSKKGGNKGLSKKTDKKENSQNSKNHKKDHGKSKKEDPNKSKKDKSTFKENEPVSEKELLRREALELGATEEDIALIEGIEDGEEEQEFGDSKNDQGFSADLSKFMKDIGLGGEVPVIDDEDVEEEEEEEEEIVEEEENVEDEVEDIEEEIEDEDLDVELDEEVADEPEPESEDEKPAKSAKKSNPDKITNLSSVDSSKLTIPNQSDWYNVVHEEVTEPEKLDRFAVERLYERAQAVIEKENKLYLKEFTSNNSQQKFLSQILTEGTLNDKISALTLLVQESPLHNIKALDTLIGYCEKKSRTASLQAINALKDLLLNGVLPDRKLKAFKNQALRKDLNDTQLALYYFEDHLKTVYFKLIQVLETLSHDAILHVRMNVLTHIFDLLKAKPEQEANLLRLGVNKLGDIDNKVASKTTYLILQLEQMHPAMTQIVVNSVTDIIFQKNNDYHAQYYSVLALNQTILNKDEPALANGLINTYFSLFEKVLVESDVHNKESSKDDGSLGKSEHGRKNNRKSLKKGKKGGVSVKAEEKTEAEVIEEKNAKLFSNLLTGLNRAIPFATVGPETYEKHMETLYRITHSSNFNTSIQALVLINHIVSVQNLNSDRYYRTLYESLMDPRLVTTSKQGIYLNLLFKSLKNDADTNRVLAFVKRILQVCCHWLNVGAIAGMLYLLMELSKSVPDVRRHIVDQAPKKKENSEEYDPRKRDPRFAGAENSSIYELFQFLTHYHPTVSIYAKSILDGTEQAKPDLGLFSLAHFLDRFVYKNAKLKPIARGSSIMQPLGGSHTGSLLVKATNVMSRDVPVNTENWLNKKAANVRPDERFFHQYFINRSDKIRTKKEEEEDDDDDSDDEDKGEDEVWQALVLSRPDVEDDSDGFDDMDEADFSDDDDEEEDGEEDGEEVLEDEEEAAAMAAFEAGEMQPQGDDEDEDEDEEIEDEEDVQDSEAAEAAEGSESDFDDEDIFAANSDELDSDMEMPAMLEEEPEPSKKRSKQSEKPKKKSKTLFKDLPLFASVDDYSQYLNSDDDI